MKNVTTLLKYIKDVHFNNISTVVGGCDITHIGYAQLIECDLFTVWINCLWSADLEIISGLCKSWL